MYKRFLMLLAGMILCGSAFAGRNVCFTGDFESGKILSLDSNHDGFFIHTLPNPQVGTNSISGGNGGFDLHTDLDTRVVMNETVGSEKVMPRAGNYFIRSALYYDKDYSELNGGKNKPRSKIYVNNDKYGVDFDEEGYLGFSIHLPKNWENETAVFGNRGEAQLLQVQSQGASWTQLRLAVYVPKGKSEAHWIFTHYLSDKSVKDEGRSTVYDLGPVTNDLGKWTDFVLRYRFNPFSARTNASTINNGKNQVYEGNKGILQLWKADGAMDSSGNRRMLLTSVNLENQPVGLVPHATKKIKWHFRIYKYGWHNNNTNVKGPVWVGFDEIRDGRVTQDRTTYADVSPSGLGCTDHCPAGSDAPGEPRDIPPMPPEDLVITD